MPSSVTRRSSATLRNLVDDRRLHPATPPSPLPAPWTMGELYAALVRCAALPFLCAIVLAIVLALLKLPPEPALGIAMYLVAWGCLARPPLTSTFVVCLGSPN